MQVNGISARTGRIDRFVIGSVRYPIAIFAIFAVVISWRILDLMFESRQAHQSDEIIANANTVIQLTSEEESAQRGYFVNGNQAFINDYESSAKAVLPALHALEELISADPIQVSRGQQIERDYSKWQLQVSTDLNTSLTFPTSFRANFDQYRETSLMRALRLDLVDIIGVQEAIKKERADRAHIEPHEILIWCGLLVILSGVGLSFAWIRHSRDFANQYEESLRVSSRNLSLLNATLMSIGDAVLVTDMRGKVLQMNPQAEMLTAWSFSDAYGMDADMVFKTLDRTTRSPLESTIKRCAIENVTSNYSDHVILVRRDETELFVDESSSIIRDEVGRPAGAILVFRDVTERNRADAELARLYEREHRISENLQRSLLSKPDPRLFPRLEVETLYQPAWAEAKVGGDYFDIIGLADGKAGLVVGDVSGKGLKAASRTAEMKFTFRAYLRETGDVADSIRRLNRFVCRSQAASDDPNSFFLCITAIVFDPVTGSGSVCVCGAECPLILRSDGTVEEIAGHGPPVGIFEDSEFFAESLVLGPGDMIVVVTDGITEARNGQEFLGNEGLAKIVSSTNRRKPLADIGARIVNETKSFAAGQLSDDVCLLLARTR